MSYEKAAEAAELMAMIAPRLKELGLVDQVIPEPLGGAHRDYDATAAAMKHALIERLAEFKRHSAEELVERRYRRYLSYGHYVN